MMEGFKKMKNLSCTTKGLLYSPRVGKTLFILSAFVCLFWYIAKNSNVYRFALIGALFELAWLPMLVLLLVLPLLSIFLLLKEKPSFKSLPLYSLLLLLAAFLFLTAKK